MQFHKRFDTDKTLELAFRRMDCLKTNIPQVTSHTWQLATTRTEEAPRYVVVGFQTDKDNNQETNPAVFDNANLQDIQVDLGSRRYPETDYNLDFNECKISRIYASAVDFRREFYGLNELAGGMQITPALFKALYPLFVIDTSKQSDRLKGGVIGVQIRMKFRANVPANTVAYALLISDKTIKV